MREQTLAIHALKANSSFELTGWALGGFITVQMVGSILGISLLWRRIWDYPLYGFPSGFMRFPIDCVKLF